MNVALVVSTKNLLRPGHVVEPFEFGAPEGIERVRRALLSAGHRVAEFEADIYLGPSLVVGSPPPDVVFNYAHGFFGLYKSAYVPVVCDMVGIPCTGADALALATCADKITLKDVARRVRMQTPDAHLCSTMSEVREHFSATNAAYMVKPNNFDSCLGVTHNAVCRTFGDIAAQAAELFENGLGPVLVERLVAGREIVFGVFGNGADLELLSPVEISLGDELEIFGNEVRHAISIGVPDVATFHQLGGVHNELAAALAERALRIFRTIGVRDLATVEFILGQDGVPYLLEINAVPDLAPLGKAAPSLLEMSCNASGMQIEDLVHGAVNAAVSRFGGLRESAAHQMQMSFDVAEGVMADG